jgi:hypothetical protein
LVISARPNPRRLANLDWRSPPDLIDAHDLTDEERHRYIVLARQRLETDRRELGVLTLIPSARLTAGIARNLDPTLR